MVLGFVSFWFAAPEFIGEARLKAWEDMSRNAIGGIPNHGFLFFILRWVVFCIALLGVFLFVGFLTLKKMPHWLTEALLFGMGVPVTVLSSQGFLEEIIWRITRRLAREGRERQRLLLIGAVLFTISFMLQFAATFPEH
jgi:hypothetical protein